MSLSLQQPTSPREGRIEQEHSRTGETGSGRRVLGDWHIPLLNTGHLKKDPIHRKESSNTCQVLDYRTFGFKSSLELYIARCLENMKQRPHCAVDLLMESETKGYAAPTPYTNEQPIEPYRNGHLKTLLVLRNVPALWHGGTTLIGSLTHYVTLRKHMAFKGLASVAPLTSVSYDVHPIRVLAEGSGLLHVGPWILDLRDLPAAQLILQAELRDSRYHDRGVYPLLSAAIRAFDSAARCHGLDEASIKVALPSSDQVSPKSIGEATPRISRRADHLDVHCKALRIQLRRSAVHRMANISSECSEECQDNSDDAERTVNDSGKLETNTNEYVVSAEPFGDDYFCVIPEKDLLESSVETAPVGNWGDWTLCEAHTCSEVADSMALKTSSNEDLEDNAAPSDTEGNNATEALQPNSGSPETECTSERAGECATVIAAHNKVWDGIGPHLTYTSDPGNTDANAVTDERASVDPDHHLEETTPEKPHFEVLDTKSTRDKTATNEASNTERCSGGEAIERDHTISVALEHTDTIAGRSEMFKVGRCSQQNAANTKANHLIHSEIIRASAEQCLLPSSAQEQQNESEGGTTQQSETATRSSAELRSISDDWQSNEESPSVGTTTHVYHEGIAEVINRAEAHADADSTKLDQTNVIESQSVQAIVDDGPSTCRRLQGNHVCKTCSCDHDADMGNRVLAADRMSSAQDASAPRLDNAHNRIATHSGNCEELRANVTEIDACARVKEDRAPVTSMATPTRHTGRSAVSCSDGSGRDQDYLINMTVNTSTTEGESCLREGSAPLSNANMSAISGYFTDQDKPSGTILGSPFYIYPPKFILPYEYEFWATDSVVLPAASDYVGKESGTLTLKRGNLALILFTTSNSWSFCRAQNGGMGYLPTAVVPDAFGYILQGQTTTARPVSYVTSYSKWNNHCFNPGEPVVVLADRGKWLLVRLVRHPHRHGYVPRNSIDYVRVARAATKLSA